MNEIIIGAIASLVASVIWFFGGQLILTIRSREKIGFLLERLFDCAEQFDTAMKFDIVDIAEVQTDKILEYSARIIEQIKTFSFFGKKKKLFYTVLYNAYYTVSHYKRLWVGYKQDQERTAILCKFKRKYYYFVTIYDKGKKGIDQQVNFFTLSVAIMQELNNTTFIKKALENNYYIDRRWNTKLVETYTDLIDAINFKSSIKSSKYDWREKTFSQDEYQKFISKKLKNSD